MLYNGNAQAAQSFPNIASRRNKAWSAWSFQLPGNGAKKPL